MFLNNYKHVRFYVRSKYVSLYSIMCLTRLELQLFSMYYVDFALIAAKSGLFEYNTLLFSPDENLGAC